VIGILAILSFVERKSTLKPLELQALTLSFILFPLGYLLINYESRYLWYMIPIAMTLGSLYLHRMRDGILKKILPYLFCLSILPVPALNLFTMYNEGKEEYTKAKQLRMQRLTGSFTTWLSRDHKMAQRIERLAYFSGMQYYSIPVGYTPEEVLNEMNRYHVNYFIMLDNDEYIKLPDGRKLNDTCKGQIEGLSVFPVNP